MADDEGKYRINVVAQKTGISAATLRAWERRYGIPVPRRTESSYRVYSDEDIALIQRLRSLCNDGMSPSEAAKVVLAEAEQPVAAAAIGLTNPYEQVRTQILDAVERFDPDALELAVNRALTLGSAAVICENVIVPVMFRVGEMWHSGEITIAQEHLASQILETTARKLIGLLQPGPGSRRVLLACFAEDEHSLPLYGIALHLAQAAFRTVMLGARTPPAAIRQSVQKLEPACVGLSVTIVPPPHRARELVDAYADACGATPWVVGGQGAAALESLITERGGVVVPATDVRQTIRTIESTIARRRRRGSKGHSP
ncbi:MAG: MerR family transcriptional regulator [Myxococcota bacterium]